MMTSSSPENLTRRATAAYLRAGGTDQPSQAHSFVYTVQNTKRRGLGAEAPEHRYVRLANVAGMLATYRVLNQGKLKRLRRWPEPAYASIHDRNREALASTIKGTIEAFRGDARV